MSKRVNRVSNIDALASNLFVLASKRVIRVSKTDELISNLFKLPSNRVARVSKIDELISNLFALVSILVVLVANVFTLISNLEALASNRFNLDSNMLVLLSTRSNREVYVFTFIPKLFMLKSVSLTELDKSETIDNIEDNALFLKVVNAVVCVELSSNTTVFNFFLFILFFYPHTF